MSAWRYWSDGSYPGDCRWLFRTAGSDRQQAYRPHTASWENIPQNNGLDWPMTLLRRAVEATGDYDGVPVDELDEWIAGNRQFCGVDGPFQSMSGVIDLPSTAADCSLLDGPARIR
jgi:hypothetical protein